MVAESIRWQAQHEEGEAGVAVVRWEEGGAVKVLPQEEEEEMVLPPVCHMEGEEVWGLYREEVAEAEAEGHPT